MRKENRTTSFVAGRISNVEQIHSLLYIDRGSMEDVEEGKIAVSEVQTLGESFLDLSRRDIEPNFKKNTAKAILQLEKEAKNKQKSKFAVGANFSPRQVSQQAINTFESDVLELQAIEKKTEDLVQKEREQRRQLKKLKKAYIQKVDELMKRELDHKTETKQLACKIQTLNRTQECLFDEKADLQKRMKVLQEEVEKTKRELCVSEQEKLDLLRKIELFEINGEYQSVRDLPSKINSDDRIRQLISNNELQSIDSEIKTIDKLIEQARNEPGNHEGKYRKMVRLLQMKNQYQQQREIVNLEAQRTIYDRTVAKLNEIAFKREKLASANKSKGNKTNENRDPLMKSEEGTKDSFFSRASFTRNQNEGFCQSKLYFEQHEQTNENDAEDMKARISSLVRSYKIIGHQQTYDVLQKLTSGIVQLYSSEECTEDDLLNLIESGLQKMNDGLVKKAKYTIDKIQKLMNHVKMLSDTKNTRQKENVLQEKEGNFSTSN